MPAPHRAEAPVVVIGAANIDIAGTAHQPLVRADSNPGRVRATPGGVGRNVAENLARLGVPTALCTGVGDDAFGAELLRGAAAAGVDVSASAALPGLATSSYLSIHGPDGDMAVAVNDMDILDALDGAWLSARAERLLTARAWVLEANLSADALAWLLSQPTRPPVFADAVSAFKVLRLRPWLGALQLLQLNRLELQALTGEPLAPGRAGLRAAAQLLHAQGLPQLVVSLGAEGAFWSERDGDHDDTHGWQPACPVPVLSVTGAGDAQLAGIVQQLLAGASLGQAVAAGVACAAFTLGSAQACHPELSPSALAPILTRLATAAPDAAPDNGGCP